jgi:tetratricopeptide (TPR) repeat protein
MLTAYSSSEVSMKTQIKFVAVLVIVLLAGATVLAEETSQAAINSMTVSELEAKGDSLQRQKDYSEAAIYFRAAIAKDRGNPVLQNKLGIALLQQSKLPSAQSAFATAVKLNKQYPEALNNLAVVYYALGNYGQAVKYYKKALALDESSASFHSNLGTAWFAQKRYDKAMAEYQRALELDPDVLMRSLQGGLAARVASPEDRAYYDFILAKLYAKMGDVERSYKCLVRAKEEGYKDMDKVYTEAEFASIRTDQRVMQLVPPTVNR